MRRNLKNIPSCFIDLDIHKHDLVEGASAIIFYGTTAGVESLMQMKRVIELGDRSVSFDFEDPPITRISSFEALEPTISTVLGSEVPEKNIYAFFGALLDCSYNFDAEQTRVTLDRTSGVFRSMAIAFSDRLLSDLDVTKSRGGNEASKIE